MSDRLAEIRERAEAATPGPWQETDQPGGVLQVVFGPLTAKGYVDYEHTNQRSGFALSVVFPGDMEDYEGEDLANAAFIAHSRADVAWLLTVAEEAVDFLIEWYSGNGQDANTCDAATSLAEALGLPYPFATAAPVRALLLGDTTPTGAAAAGVAS